MVLSVGKGKENGHCGRHLNPCLPAWWLQAWEVRAFPSLAGTINIHRLVIGVVLKPSYCVGWIQ